jgi:hypothetical protein
MMKSANGARRRSGGLNGVIRRSGALSAATIEALNEAIRLHERGIALMRQILDDNEAAGAVEQSWTHAPLH